MLKQQIEQDLKEALLGGQKDRAMTLRGLKSVILYAEVAAGSREQGLSDEQIVQLFAKEAKKRQESADFYVKGGSQDRADAELAEKKIIEAYLPQQLSDEELLKVIDDAIRVLDVTSPQGMGQVIGKVKQATEGRADGGRIAQFVKERLK
ncbi:MAG TPA: GatB/YqeY domain-containing protein [Candidatus Saccharimonadales bacterium]|nr:GatB/YqeY domain-containing protein [Candidatus Saccharimonadales bacterium]